MINLVIKRVLPAINGMELGLATIDHDGTEEHVESLVVARLTGTQKWELFNRGTSDDLVPALREWNAMLTDEEWPWSWHIGDLICNTIM